jgi:glycosyltransferase involved in cell wall biosynthesis
MVGAVETESTAKLPSLSFVFPMYNELGNIERCVTWAIDVGHKMADDLEIVVVDDASTDGSGALADRLADEHGELRVIHHVVNRKLGGAIKTGLANASKDWVLYIDSDLPIDLNESLRAVSPALEGADLVIGWRRNRSEGIKREIMSWVYNRIIRSLFGLKVIDVNFAFKMIRRDVLRYITLDSEGSFIDAELLIRARRLGATIAEIGLDYYPRTAGVSTLASMSVVMKIFEEMWSFAKRRPVRRADLPSYELHEPARDYEPASAPHR